LSSEEEKEYGIGLTYRMIILIPVIAVLSTIQNFVTNTLGMWWAYRSWIPPPLILIIVPLYLLGRRNKKFRLMPQEYGVLATLCFLSANTFLYGYWMSGSFGPAVISTWSQLFPIWMLTHDPLKEMAPYIPPWMSAKSESALKGMMYGGVVDWGEWIPSILYWSIFFLIWTTFELFWGYYLRKQMIEIERLPFPGILPMAYLIKYSIEDGEKPKLFNFSLALSKTFWVAFILGFLTTFLDFIRFFFPAVPSSEYVGLFRIDLTPYIQDILPGAYFISTTRTTDVFIFLLCPTDFIITAIAAWVVFAVLYNVIGIRAGIIPVISPGAGGSQGPFKYNQFGYYCALGVGIWMIWINRKHFANILRHAFSTYRSGEDGGLSFRFLGLGTIAITLIFWVFLVASGVPVIVALMMMVLTLLMLYGGTRMMGDVQQWFPYGGHPAGFLYDIGGFAGAWPREPPISNVASFRTFTLQYTWSYWGSRIGNVTMWQQMKTYKVAYMTKTKAKDVFLTSLLCYVCFAIIVFPLTIWWYHNFGGFAKLSNIAYYQWHSPHVYNMLTNGPTLPFEERATLAAAGIIVPIVLYLLRSTFPWFIINPTGLMILPFIGWIWLGGIIALVAKLVILRVGGAKIFEERVVPFAIGYNVGYGVNAALLGLLATFTICLPKIL